MSFGDSVVRTTTHPRMGVVGFSLPFHATVSTALVVDAVLILSTSVATGLGYTTLSGKGEADPGAWIGVGAVMAGLFVFVFNAGHSYKTSELMTFRRQARRLLLVWAAVFVFLTFVAFTMKIGAVLSRGAVLSFAVAGPMVLLGARGFWHAALARAFANGALVARKIAVISDRPIVPGSDRARDFDSNRLRILKQFTWPDGGADAPFVRSLTASLRGSDVDEIYICADWSRLLDVRELMAGLRALPLPVRLVPDGASCDLFHRPWQEFGSSIAIEMQRSPIGVAARSVKRGLDIAVASLALAVGTPVLLIAIAAIRWETCGPVVFRQRRLGFNGKPFRILKLRSMVVLEDGACVRQAQLGDERVTRVGRFLRRWSLDELPQLVNVLRGEMSMVGPRPHAVAHDNHYDALIAHYALRHHVRPGLTGWAQVNGWRGETPTVDLMERRLDHDIWYIDHWSLWLDIRILLRTALVLVRRESVPY